MYDNEYYAAFRKGFFITSKFLLNRNISVNILDTLLTGRSITPEAINEIITDIQSNNNARTDLHRERLQWFYNILRDDGTLFPTQHAVENPSTPQDVNEFKKQLLLYWTGNRDYKDDRDINKPYKVYFNQGNQFAVRTCHKIIELPIGPNYKQNEPFTQENYYKRLLENSVQTGMGII